MRRAAAIEPVGARMSHPPEKEARSFLVLTIRVNSESRTRRLRAFFSQPARTRAYPGSGGVLPGRVGRWSFSLINSFGVARRVKDNGYLRSSLLVPQCSRRC